MEQAAELAMLAMLKALRSENLSAVCAVCDDHGELVALVRRDGAPLSSVKIAANKAYCAARERQPSRGIGAASRDPSNGFDMGYYGDTRYTGWAGGFALMRGAVVVGGVGVSGLTEEDDERIATIGKTAFESAT